MPKINRGFLFRLMGICLVAVGSLAGLHALQEDRIATALRRQAERAEAESRWDAAIHYYHQYLELRRTDVEALERLAELLRRRQSSPRGLAEVLFLYDRILGLEPQRLEVRRQALAASLAIGRYSDALVHADELLKHAPQDPSLWQQKGAALAGLHQLPQARQCYEQAVALAPQEVLGYQRLAQLLWRNLNDPAAARDALHRMVDALPHEPQAYLTRARFEIYLNDSSGQPGGDLDLAARDLQKVFLLDPENSEAALLLADIYQRRGRLDAAYVLLRDAYSLHPKDLQLLKSLAWLEVSRGHIPMAVALLEDALRRLPHSHELMIPLADLLIQQGDREKTAALLQRMAAQPVPLYQQKYLHIRLAMHQQQWAAALQQIDELLRQITQFPALEVQLHLLRARCAAELCDRPAAEQAYRRVLLAEPQHIQAQYQLALLYMDEGRTDDALRLWDQLLHNPHANGPLLTYALHCKAHVLRRRGGSSEEWKRLEAAAATIAARFPPHTPEPHLVQALVLAAQNRRTEAISLLRNALQRQPTETRLWTALIEQTAELAGTTAAFAVLDEARAACGDRAELRLVQAALQVREPGRLRPLTPLVQSLEHWPETEQSRLLYGLLDYCDAAGDAELLLQLLRQLATHRPDDKLLWLRLCQHAQAAGQISLAAEVRDRLQRLYGPDETTLLLCQALAAPAAEAAHWIARLDSACSAQPLTADIAWIYSLLHERAGDLVHARHWAETAFQRQPTHFHAASRVGILLELHDPVAADAFWQRILLDPRWTPLAVQRLIRTIGAALPARQRPRFLARLRPPLERFPEGLAWLADAATHLRWPEAAALWRQAAAHPHASPDAWLQQALLSDAATLQEARPRLSSPSYAAAVAVWCLATGQPRPNLDSVEERRIFTQTTLGLLLDRGQRREATALLQEFLADKRLTSAEIAWAKRHLALLYATQPDEDARQKAWELIQSPLGEWGASAAELRAAAQTLVVLSRYVDGPRRRTVLEQAARTLEQTWQKGQSPMDLYDLARLYRWLGRRADSRHCLQQLLNADPDNVHYLTAALEELTDAGETAAAAFAERLYARHPSDVRAVAALARYWCRTGQAEKAVSLLESFPAQAGSTAEDAWTRRAQAAELLDELSRIPQLRGQPVARQMSQRAAEFYTRLVPQRPEAAVGLAGVLAAADLPANAFSELERLKVYLNPRLRATAGLAILRNARCNDEQAATVLRWVEAALADDPNSLPLRLLRAEYYTLRQDWETATREYRRLLQEHPQHVIILNNLAWLLAGEAATAPEALELVQRAIRRNGLSGDLLDTRARIRISLKQFDAARDDLEEAIRLEATPLRLFHLALVHYLQTPPQTSAAAEAFRRALQAGLHERMIHPADLGSFQRLKELPPE